MAHARTARLLAALAVSLVLAACGGGGDGGDEAEAPAPAPSEGNGSGGDGAVTIVDFEFDPEPVEVEAGTTVTWTNDDTATHSVKGGGELEFESEDLAEGDTHEQTYDEAGEFPYVCEIHPSMEGTVIVE